MIVSWILSHPDLNVPQWRATVTNPIFFSPMYLWCGNFILLMNSIVHGDGYCTRAAISDLWNKSVLIMSN